MAEIPHSGFQQYRAKMLHKSRKHKTTILVIAHGYRYILQTSGFFLCLRGGALCASVFLGPFTRKSVRCASACPSQL
jgi:hypothetical protein